MGISGGPNILGDENLAFIYDLAEANSYVGEPTTNLIGLYPVTANPSGMVFNYEYTVTIVNPPVYGTPFDNQKWLKFEKNNASNGRATFLSIGSLVPNGIYTWSAYVYTPDSNVSSISMGTDNTGVSVTLTNSPYNMGNRGTVQRIYNVLRSINGSVLHGIRGGSSDPIGSTWYATGFQFEFKDHLTQPVTGSRSISGSLFDLSTNKTQLTLNTSYNSSSEITFDGTDDYIDTNSINIISGTGDFTIESFYNMTGQVGGAIFGNYGTGYSTGLWFSGQYGIYIQGAVYAPGAPLPNGKYHMVATRLGGIVTLYRNGLSVASGTLSSAIPSNINYRIGADVNGAAEPFTGQIYNLKVYNRALSASEVLQNYNALKSRYNL
jgi:hypothetical protein